MFTSSWLGLAFSLTLQASTMNNNESRADLDTITDLPRLLRLQKDAVIREGTPNLSLRHDRLARLSSMLHTNRQELADAISQDFGNRAQATSLLYDVLALIASIAHTREHFPIWSQPDINPAPAPGVISRVEYQPKGVVGVISPWNFPVQLALGPIIGILAAGNRAMLKPSELTPITSELLKSLVGSAFDEAEIAVVTGGQAVGAAFTELSFDHLVFTGGTAVGKHVARAAANNLVPLTLELGGKSPAIVSNTVDLEQAVSRIMSAKVLNSGQLCVSPDYVLVPYDKQDAFVQIAKTVTSQLFPSLIGNPDYTSIVNNHHFNRINDLIEDARDKDANIVPLSPMGEPSVNSETRQIAPTLVLNVQEGQKILEEEIFGPLLPVVTYSNVDEAINYVNSRPRPLALYYFGTDADEERLVLDKTVSGGVTINDCISHLSDENLPFGGVGPSGYGHYHGIYGFRTFSHAKAVYRQADVTPVAALLNPPFGEQNQSFLEQAFAAFQAK